MKKTLVSLFIAAVTATPVFAAPDLYIVDSNHTFPSFEVNHLGFSTHRGRFNKTEGKITLDIAAKTGTVELTIDAASVNTGGEKLETHLRAEDFFNVPMFPAITFKSNKLTFDGDKVVGLEGDFTLLGVTKPIKLTVNNFKCGAHPFNKKLLCGAEVVGSLKRTDFGMKYGVPAIGEEIKLMVQIEAYKS